MNVAAETHVDRSIDGATEFVSTNVLGTQVLLDWAREHGVRYVQVSTDEVYGDIDSGSSREGDPIRPSSPYAASKAAGDLLALPSVRTHGVDVVDHARLEHLRPEPVPGEAHPVLHDERARRQAAAGLRRRPPDPRLAPRGRPRRGDRARPPRGQDGRGLQHRRRRGGRERRDRRRIVELTGADPALVTRVEDRPGHDRRYALDATKLKALGWSPDAQPRRRPARDGRVVPNPP